MTRAQKIKLDLLIKPENQSVAARRGKSGRVLGAV